MCIKNVIYVQTFLDSYKVVSWVTTVHVTSLCLSIVVNTLSMSDIAAPFLTLALRLLHDFFVFFALAAFDCGLTDVCP